MSAVLVSQRGVARSLQLGFAAWLEAEDVLVECGGARLVETPIDGRSNRVRVRRVLGRAARRTLGPRVVLPMISSPRIGRADHLIFMARSPWDLPVIEGLGRGRKPAEVVSLWLPEVWPVHLRDRRIFHEAYSMVDHIHVGNPEVLDDFASVAPHATVAYLPTAVDVLGFVGQPWPRQPPVAVVGIGRRHRHQHEVLLNWCEANDVLYLYDTIGGSPVDWRTHRRSMAGWYRNSAVAICNYGKHDQPELVGDLKAIPARLFEGLAAGCRLIGMAPSPEHQLLTLGREVVEDCADEHLPEVLEQAVFGDDPAQRAQRIALACEGHDWAHRWVELLRTADQPLSPGLQNRLVLLDDMAKQAAEAS